MNDNTLENRERRQFITSSTCLLAAASLGQSGCDKPADTDTRLIEDPGWGDPSTLVSEIAAGTVAVPDVAAQVDAFREWFKYVEYWRGTVPQSLADFWGAPAVAGQPAAVVGPRGVNAGFFRFVELGSDFKRIPLYSTLGWVALEIRARDVDALVSELAGSPFEHVGGPADLKFGDMPVTLRAAQFRGLEGEPLIFTEDLKYDRSNVLGEGNAGPLFIQTLAVHPYAPARDFYLQRLKMKLSLEVSYSMRNVIRALGLSDEQQLTMSAVRTTDYCSIELDEYPPEVTQRPTAAGSLPPAVCMCSHATRHLDQVATALQEEGLAFSRLEANPIAPHEGARLLFARGHSGERLEFVEAAGA